MSKNDLIILNDIISSNKSEIAPNMRDDDFFEFLVSREITKDHSISNEQIEEGILGGGLDGGIDSFYIFINGSLIEEDTILPDIKQSINIDIVISQAKNKTGYEEEVINKFISVSEEIFTLENNLENYKGVYSESLIDLAGRFRNAYMHYASRLPNLHFSYYYGCRATSDPTNNIKRKADTLKEKLKSLFSSSTCDFTFLGASALLSLIRRRPKSIFELKLAETPISSSEGTSFIGLVKLYDYFEFITDSNKLVYHIFEANVRDWQGNNSVNKQILDTLNSPKEDFWWLNNGITILSSSVNLHGRKIMNIENPEIVNGLQTSRAIYHHFSSLQEQGQHQDSDIRSLLVRIIVPEELESRDRIIFATNNQTAIPIEALKSTQKIHRDIEAHLLKSSIYYDRRRNHWKLERKPVAHIITMKKMAQVVLSIAKYQPNMAKSNPSSVFQKGNESVYNSVFSPDYPIELYQFCAELLIKVEEMLKHDSIVTSLNQRSVGQIKFHVLTHVTIRKTKNLTPVPEQIARLKRESFDDNLIIDSIQRIISIFMDLGPNNITSKSLDFYQKVINDAKGLID